MDTRIGEFHGPSVSAAIVACFLCAGCGAGNTETDAGDSSVADSDILETEACQRIDEISAVEGDLSGAADDFATECGFDGAPDLAYVWTAPTTGTYGIISNRCSNEYGTETYTCRPPRIAVLDGDCGGDVLECSRTEHHWSGESDITSFWSVLYVPLVEGQVITIVVEQELGTEFSFTIGNRSCATDLGSVHWFSNDLYMQGSTTRYLWTAPVSGEVRLSATPDPSESWATASVSVADEPCMGDVFESADVVTLELDAGQSIGILVDSSYNAEEPGNTEFTLSTASSDWCTTLGAHEFWLEDSVEATTGGLENNFGLGLFASPDAAFGFRAPSAGTYRFTVTSVEARPVLYALDDLCGGALLARFIGDVDSTEVTGELTLEADQVVTLVVEGRGEGGSPISLDFTLSVE